MAARICEHSTVRSPHPAGDLDKPPSAMYYETISRLPAEKSRPVRAFSPGEKALTSIEKEGMVL